MPRDNIKVSLETHGNERVSPGDVILNVTLSNAGDAPVTLNLYQAASPSLSLQIKDAEGRPVLLKPPPVPWSGDERINETPLSPGESHSFVMGGLFDLSQPAGTYRVRYYYTGGYDETVIASEWMEISTVAAERTAVESISVASQGFFYRFFCWIIYVLLGFLFKKPCKRVVSAEVDREISETITNAPPPDEAWNGTYGWRARFRLTLDQPKCRVVVTVKIRTNGAVTAAQKTAWENAIEAKWSNRFKLCCTEDCCKTCCPKGYTIVVDLQYVNTGEHQVVTGGASTVNMGNWGAADTVDVAHEFGHMLGNPDEYFTVNGTNYGAPRQAGGNIMNNPANDPLPRHFNIIKEEAENLIGGGTTCSVKSVNDAC